MIMANTITKPIATIYLEAGLPFAIENLKKHLHNIAHSIR
jgi:hypothetical protein